MSLITYVEVNNGTSGTIPLPVNTAIRARRITRLELGGSEVLATGVRMFVNVTGVRVASGGTFTYRGGVESATGCGMQIPFQHNDELIVEASVLQTITYTTGAAVTWTGIAWYDAIAG